MSITRKQLLLLLIFILAAPITDARADDLSEKTANLLHIFKKFHYRDLSLDGKVASEIQNSFINDLDPLRIVFTKSDVDQLLSIKLDLAFTKDTKSIPFFIKTAECFHQKLIEAGDIVKDSVNDNPDYRQYETIVFDKNLPFAIDKADLKKRWQKYIKLRVLSRFFHKTYRGEPLKNYGKSFAGEESTIRAAVVKREIGIIKSILNPPRGFESLASAIFLNAIAARFDPHSQYLSSKDKANFENALSARGLSFGISFTRSMAGEVRVDRLVPGGPAWKSGKLNKGDIVTELNFPLEHDKTLYADDLSSGDPNGLVNDSGTDKIIITVVKTNGRTVKASLVKEKLQLEQNRITSYILKGEKKIGYICLPAFYMEWDAPGAPASANDVSLEILKLKKEHVDGIILDLRNNSGGSLYEAVQLAGIFIDEGPLFIQHARGYRPSIIKDPNRGTVYEGPLLVMVNRQSASASEFFISVMKDYNRAVIVGSTTFGKASSQMLLPLVADIENIDPNSLIKKKYSDYVKITTGMFYNLSCGTHQLYGIAPDIAVPEILEDSYGTEKKERYPLTPGTIQKQVAYEKLPYLPIGTLRAWSSARVAQHYGFNEIRAFNYSMQGYYSERRTIPLNMDAYINEKNFVIQSMNSLGKKVSRDSTQFSVTTTGYDAELLKMDQYKQELSAHFGRLVSEDIYIDEAYSILRDYIKLVPRKGEQ